MKITPEKIKIAREKQTVVVYLALFDDPYGNFVVSALKITLATSTSYHGGEMEKVRHGKGSSGARWFKGSLVKSSSSG